MDFSVSSQPVFMAPVDSRPPCNVELRSQDIVYTQRMSCSVNTVKEPTNWKTVHTSSTTPFKKLKLTGPFHAGDGNKCESETFSEQEDAAEMSSRPDHVTLFNRYQKSGLIQQKENTGSENKNMGVGEHKKASTAAPSQHQTVRARSRTIPKKLAHLSPEQREEKRNRQNFQERNRMGNLTDAFHRLAKALPAHLHKENMTKILTLRNAKTWIRQLRAMLRDCDTAPSSEEQQQQQHHDHHRPHYQQQQQMGQCGVYSGGMDEGFWSGHCQVLSPLSARGGLSSFDSGHTSFHSPGIDFSPHSLYSMTPTTTPALSPSTTAGGPLFRDSPQISHIPTPTHSGLYPREQCIPPSPYFPPFPSGEFMHSTPAGRPVRLPSRQMPWTSLHDVNQNVLGHSSWTSTSPTENVIADYPIRSSCMNLSQEPNDFVNQDTDRAPSGIAQRLPCQFIDQNSMTSATYENVLAETPGRESRHVSGQELWVHTSSNDVSTNCLESSNFGWNDSSGYASFSVNGGAESPASRVAGSEWRNGSVSSRDWLEASESSSWAL